jgi:hypothetical protein
MQERAWLGRELAQAARLAVQACEPRAEHRRQAARVSRAGGRRCAARACVGGASAGCAGGVEQLLACGSAWARGRWCRRGASV